MARTHEVFNQSTPFQDHNLWATDEPLRDAVRVLGAGRPTDELDAFGAQCGSAEAQELARLANENGPVLRAFDRSGRRVDDVDFHPAWHALMARLIGSGAHSQPWGEPGAGAQVVRGAKYVLFGQAENGSQCPTTMTFAVVPVIARQSALARDWMPKLLSREYDPRTLPASAKRGVLMGMGMTEKQGGSDVRANSTRAMHVGRSEWGEEYRLTGHKWFVSAPQCDAHLVIAKIDGEALSCFFMPRFRPDGTRNAVEIQRLKNKVGNKSNASSEIEFDGASAWLVGEAGRGVPTILEMGNHTRLDCALGGAGIMRGALTHALHHARERSAFGRLLAEQPLMRNVLADLALESEAATWLALRLARSYDADADRRELLLRRVLTPVAKYWICKRTPAMVAEAMEVLGGNGYVEDGPLGRLFRESPLNSIWEGSGNVMCLDMLRAMARTPEVRDALMHELNSARGTHAGYDHALDAVAAWLALPLDDEYLARRRTEQLAIMLQASLLLRHAPAQVAEAFVASRIDAGWSGSFGTLPPGLDIAAILARALPA